MCSSGTGPWACPGRRSPRGSPCFAHLCSSSHAPRPRSAQSRQLLPPRPRPSLRLPAPSTLFLAGLPRPCSSVFPPLIISVAVWFFLLESCLLSFPQAPSSLLGGSQQSLSFTLLPHGAPRIRVKGGGK